MSEAARALIEEHTALEVQRLEGGLARAGLSDALALLESGELSALSRVDASALDPIVQGYVESIVRLGAEAEVLERADTGAFKALLQGHALELEQARDAAALKRGTLADIHSRLAESDLSALGQLETATAAGTADPILTALVEQWTEIDGRLRRLEVDFTDALPEVRSLRAERDALVARLAGIVGARVAGLDAQLAEYDALSGRRAERVDALPDAEREQIRTAQARLQERAQDHLRARLAGLDAHDGRLGNELEGLAVRLAELPENERALARPMRAVATHSELVQLLMMRQQEAEITRAASLASAEFIDAATPPRRPTGPSLPVHVALGLLLGLAAAAGWALLRESQASGVFTSAELETASGLPVVGSIPAFKKASARRASPAGASFVPLRDEPDGAVAEAFRALRANLKFMIRSKDSGTTLAVTSSGPGEGKSMTNVDIALSFAATGKRVLLVDADMRRGSVSDYLGIARGPGLSEALQERADWRASLVTSCHDSLDVLPAGDVPASPGDLLASPRTTALVEEMRGDYDLVVLDVPPVLAVADIECVATQLDTVLLLCRSGKTLDATVQQSVSRLRLVGANVVAAVLNGVQAKRGSYGYGYGYGYGQKSSERAA
ncbi:MAG: polysaccharide biosynthesis tyrosine autokinase [Planctomycetota bacterium]